MHAPLSAPSVCQQLTSAENNHARPLRESPHGKVVDPLDVLDNVTPQRVRVLLLVRVEVQHVTNRAVRKRGRKDGDLVLRSPVVY